MYVGTSIQFRAYDKALLDLGYSIEELVNMASNQLIKHFNNYNKVLIISGPGNNGADGISLALKLKAKGVKVKLFFLGEFDHLSSANRFYLTKAKEVYLDTTFLDEEGVIVLEKEIEDYDVVVDAMFGFGLNSDLRGISTSVVDIVNNNFDKDVIAVDIPTGLNCDTGLPYNSCILATKTITLTAYKLAFLNEETKIYTGDIILEKLDTKDLCEVQGLAKVINHQWVKYNLKPRKYYGFKGDYGYIVHITGSDIYRGAAILASKASVNTGSGIVTVCSTDKVLDNVTNTTPECTLLSRQDLSSELLNKKDAILLGSGLSLNKEVFDLTIRVLSNVDAPMVIDGDGLNILSQNIELLENHRGPLILTPHIGEFKRFVSFDGEAQMVEKAYEFAKRYHVVLVLKGANTIIVDEEEMYRNPTANKAMATAGMGDALAGIIVSFLGQKYSPLNAAIIGTYLHGLCGDYVAKDNYTVLPTKLIDTIPYMMNKIITEK
ncbi:MAG: NAD(P)H-hydrate dehydratase [Thomasclavelia sp.]|jgi:hydroxyethylthiazole kinase-like uncharacterized protein yjeF|nr:NAD(P)H-hydrate dehydratase [Thomasclavelia sp.]